MLFFVGYKFTTIIFYYNRRASTRLLFVFFKLSRVTRKFSTWSGLKKSIIFVLFSPTFRHPFLVSIFQRLLTQFTLGQSFTLFRNFLFVFTYSKETSPMLRTFKQTPVPWAFLDRMLYVSAVTHVAIGKLNSLVPTSNVKRVFDAKQNLRWALYSCSSESDASARFVAHGVFMDEVRDKVKRSGFIEISSRGMTHESHESDLSATVPDSAFGELGRRRFTRD